MILHSEALIREYTSKGYWGTRTLLDKFRENCERHPSRVAVEDPPDRRELLGSEPRTLTYGELGRAVDAVATALVRMGLRKDDIVVVQLPNVWELAMLYLAVARAGGIISPLPWQWRERDVGYIAKLAGSRFYIGPEEFKGFKHLEMARRLGFEHVVSLEEVNEMAKDGVEPRLLEAVRVDANDVFTLCWTSGTEAEPKGCPLTHNNWFFQGNLVVKVSKGREGDRILCVAPLVNMSGIVSSLVPWILEAGTLIMHHPINIQVLLEQLTRGNVQSTGLVPAVLNMILKLPNVDKLDLSSVRTIGTGSAPPSAWAIEEFKRRWGIEIINMWGQNEGTGIVAGPDDVPDYKARSTCFPWWGKKGCRWPSGIEGVEIKVLDDADQEVTDPGSVGELCYRGPNLFPGYFRRPDLNSRAFTPDGFFRTGDLFIIYDSCHIGFYDRKKDVINRGGFKIPSAEVENVVQGHPKVAECAAVPMPDERLGEKVCIFVVPKDPNNPPTLEEIVEYCKEKGMTIYKLPERLEIIHQLPRNPLGKILKNELRAELKRRLTAQAKT